MKKRNWVLGLGLLVIFSLACSMFGQLLPQGGPQALSAQADSPASVRLAWPAVAGADGYLLEGQYGNGDFFEIDRPPAGTTSFTHFVVPGSAQVTYRLSAVVAGDNKEVGSVLVKLPALAPNPLVLAEWQPFAPTVSGLPDFSKLPTIDPQHPDLKAVATRAAMAAQFAQGAGSAPAPVYAKQEIGAAGGQLTLTSPDGTLFTLDVPAGAVAEKTTFYLIPIQTIGQFPFAGGPLAAVQVHPPVPFALPLGLTITLPEGKTLSDGALATGFMVSSFNHEFSLAPVYAAGQNSYHLNVYWGDVFGISAATPQELQAQSARIPTDSAEQLAQQLAALLATNADGSAAGRQRVFTQVMAGLWAQSGNFLVSGLPGASAHLAAPAARAGAAPQQQSAGARLVESLNTWERTWNEEQYNPLYDQSNPTYQPLNPDSRAKLIRDMAQAIHDFLKAHEGCRTKDDFYAESLLQIVRNPEGDFQERISENYKSRFGNPEADKQCTFQFHIVKSQIVGTAKQQDGELRTTVVVHAEPFELQVVTRGNRFALRGAGGVTYEQYKLYFSICPPEVIETNYPASTIWITDLMPVFGSDDRLSGFVLQGALPDPIIAAPNNSSLTLDIDDAGNCKIKSYSLSGEPPDWWGMTFPSMHSRFMQEDHWSIVGEDSYVATDTITNRVESIGTEDTSIVLTVNKK